MSETALQMDDKSASADGNKGSAASKQEESAIRLPDKVHTWPHLVRNEFLCAVIVTAILVIWSVVLNAPLEEPADPTRTPNPSKAPWYFLGLQEMLVYFDPWMAGVVLPTLIIVGLMVIPYVDINPKGNGYYTVSERKFAIYTFLFGFLILWIALIIIGTFLRGPGWYWFWPWEEWDVHKTVAITNVDLPATFLFKWMGNPKIFGVELIGLVLINGFFAVPTLWVWKKFGSLKGHVVQKLGLVRYLIVATLFLIMMALPVKMLLRLAFNVKYVWVTPWFNI